MLGDGEEASSVKAECSGEEKSVLVSVMMTPVSDARSSKIIYDPGSQKEVKGC